MFEEAIAMWPGDAWSRKYGVLRFETPNPHHWIAWPLEVHAGPIFHVWILTKIPKYVYMFFDLFFNAGMVKWTELCSYTFSRFFSSGNARARDPLEAELREAPQRGGRSHLFFRLLWVFRMEMSIDFTSNCQLLWLKTREARSQGLNSQIWCVGQTNCDKQRCFKCLEGNPAKSWLIGLHGRQL